MTAPSIPTVTPKVNQGRSIDELVKTASASRITTFHQCRLKFFFQYVLGLPRNKTGALYIGSMVHGVLQYWNKARWRKQIADRDKLRQVFNEQWVEEQKNEPLVWHQDEESDCKTMAWSLLDTYFEKTPIPANEMPEGVEVSVEADLSNHGLPKLIGIIDLVRAGGRIVDFKTASQTPSEGKAVHLHETQLSGYAVLYREATGHKESGLELHHLVKLKTPKLVVTRSEPMTQSQESRLFRVLESYQNGILSEDWVPNPNVMSCACCEYYSACRKWS